MRVLIIANGEPVGEKKARRLANGADFIIAADGGISSCRKWNIEPDYLIGDLDSVAQLEPPFPKEKTSHNPDQYSTDMEKALAFALQKGPTQIDVLNALGKRTDHAFGNLFFLYTFKGNCPLVLHDRFGAMRTMDAGTHTLEGLSGRTASLFAPRRVSGVKLNGFKYPLDEDEIGPMFVGVSNEIESQKAEISIGKGRLFFYLLDETGH